MDGADPAWATVAFQAAAVPTARTSGSERAFKHRTLDMGPLRPKLEAVSVYYVLAPKSVNRGAGSDGMFSLPAATGQESAGIGVRYVPHPWDDLRFVVWARRWTRELRRKLQSILGRSYAGAACRLA